MVVTDDMRRLINVLVDWMVERSPPSSNVLQHKVVLKVLEEQGDHAQRLSFALSMALGVEDEKVFEYAKTSEGEDAISEILSRCQRVFLA